MTLLRNLSCAFTAGVIGAVILVMAKTAIFGYSGDIMTFKYNLYRLMIWGGIWGLLLIFPFYKNNWFVRGTIIALAVILFNFIILIPLAGGGFFAINVGLVVFFGNIGFNYLWGLVSAYFYHKANT